MSEKEREQESLELKPVGFSDPTKERGKKKAG